MKRLALGIGALFLVAGIAVFIAANRVDSFMQSPMALPEDGLEVTIEPGSSFAAVTRDLLEAGAIEDDLWLRVHVRRHGVGGAIQAGEYLLEPGTSPQQALDQFIKGSVRLYSFTIVPGWNRWELLAALHSNEFVEATLTDEDWPALLESLGSATSNPEGMFLPETYRFARGTSDRDLLKQAFELLQTVLDEEWQARAEETPVKSPYEALILASIVEKETARGDERARIAGVFKRRLEKRMRLQTDPTVIYGIGKDFNGNLTREDLRTDTPYNTYTRHGLPPTPIAMAGRQAINAALHPEDGTELYFVATGLGDGSHAFSDTKAEHDKAVAEYLKRLRAGRSKSQ